MVRRRNCAGVTGRKEASGLRIWESVKLTTDYESSNVHPWLRKRTPRKMRRAPSSATWIVSAERNLCSTAQKNPQEQRNPASPRRAAAAARPVEAIVSYIGCLLAQI